MRTIMTQIGTSMVRRVIIYYQALAVTLVAPEFLPGACPAVAGATLAGHL